MADSHQSLLNTQFMAFLMRKREKNHLFFAIKNIKLEKKFKKKPKKSKKKLFQIKNIHFESSFQLFPNLFVRQRVWHDNNEKNPLKQIQMSRIDCSTNECVWVTQKSVHCPSSIIATTVTKAYAIPIVIAIGTHSLFRYIVVRLAFN